MPLSALFLVGKVEAGHTDDVKKRLTHNPGGCVVDLSQASFQPAGRNKRVDQKGEKTRGYDVGKTRDSLCPHLCV